jgi:putative heme-binding domain-containing protein
MAALTRSPLPDVAAQAAWWLTYRQSNLWRTYPAAGLQPAGRPGDAAEWDRIRGLQATVWNDSLFIERRVSAAMELAGESLGGRMLMAMYGENEWRHTFQDNGAWQINAALRAALANNPDPTVRSFVLKKLPHTPPDPAPSADAAAALSGDVERGEVRFALHCARCHKAGAAGADIGPDLSAIRTKYDRLGLLDAVVNPDDAVAHNYEAWLVTTHEGYATLGFLLSEGETVVIQDVAGRRESLPADSVKERRPLDASLMPSASVLGLSDQDLADLAAYLFSLP